MAQPIVPDTSVEALVSQANAISVSWEEQACAGLRIRSLINESADKAASAKTDPEGFRQALFRLEKLFKRECTRVSNFCAEQLNSIEEEQGELKKIHEVESSPVDYRMVKPVPGERLKETTVEQRNMDSISIHSSGKRKIRPNAMRNSVSKHASGKRRVRSPPVHAKRQRHGYASGMEVEKNDSKNNSQQPAQPNADSTVLKNRNMQKRWHKLQKKATMLTMFFNVNMQILTLCCENMEHKQRKVNEKSAKEGIHKTIEMLRKIISKRKEKLKIKFEGVKEDMTDGREFRNLMKESKEDDPDLQDDDSKDFRYRYENVPVVRQLDLHKLAAASKTKLRLVMSVNALSEPITVPVLVAKGKYAGKVLCLTSAIHGNELNGIPVIHKLFSEIDTEELGGTIVAIPVLNPPGFLRHQRVFSDGKDLNRYFPGKWNGDCSSAYVHTIVEKIVSHVDFLIDMHTASFGRVNSFYVRANMRDPASRQMALLQNPQFIVHNSSPEGSLRGVAQSRGVPAITVEIGNPQIFHKDLIRFTIEGIENILCHLNMLPDAVEPPSQLPVICNSSSWLFLQHGGILNTFHVVGARVKKGQVIGSIRNIFGDLVHEYTAPYNSVVIGKNVNPACQVGDRLVHLGLIGTEFREDVQDGH